MRRTGKEEISRAMRKETLARGWEVAATEAYPELLVVNSPTAGIPERLAARVAEVLGAMARMTIETAHGRAGRRKRRAPLEWQDPATGLRLRLAGD